MVHPVQSVIESLYAAGRCPRLHVNALSEGVVCPDFIREQWKERLIIDLDPSYPLDLIFEAETLSADLSFGGYITRCTFPYAGIYVVADRSTGRGIVLDQNMPESVRRMRQANAGRAQTPDDGKLPLRSVAPESAGVHPPETATEQGDASASETEVTPPTEGDEQVQKRRAAFRVIDGGS